ncbi:15990_t:CDS:2, partial [Gigaspora margarita]
TSHEGENAKSRQFMDPSDSILDQPLPNNLLLPLVLNSTIETPDVSKLPIEVTYCKAVVEQHPIYLILNTGSSKSLVSYDFLKRIRKSIDKPSTRNLINVHRQRRHSLGIVENLPIEINKMTIPINVKASIVKIGKDYVNIEGVEQSKEKYKQVREGIQINNMNLECLVDNLDKELEIPEDSDGVNKLKE